MAALALAGAALAGCGRRAPNVTPDGAVRELVDRMARVNGDPADAKAVYELLSKRTQANLAARAHRYSDASGKPIAPEAMIAPSHFLLRFQPERYAATISGTYAMVDVSGLLTGERAQFQCVQEDNLWRVELGLPSLPPVQMRPGTTPQ